MQPGRHQLPALAARAQLGDRAALEALLRILHPSLTAHVRILMADDDAADDVVQDSLLIIARRLGTLKDVAWVSAWSYRIATREAYRALRRAGRWRSEGLEAAGETPQPDTLDESEDSPQGHLLEHLRLLPPKAQVVVRLRFIESLSQQEIAESLEIPLGTVKSRLAYGLQCLRQSLGPREAPSSTDGVTAGGVARARTRP